MIVDRRNPILHRVIYSCLHRSVYSVPCMLNTNVPYSGFCMREVRARASRPNFLAEEPDSFMKSLCRGFANLPSTSMERMKTAEIVRMGEPIAMAAVEFFPCCSRQTSSYPNKSSSTRSRAQPSLERTPFSVSSSSNCPLDFPAADSKCARPPVSR